MSFIFCSFVFKIILRRTKHDNRLIIKKDEEKNSNRNSWSAKLKKKSRMSCEH